MLIEAKGADGSPWTGTGFVYRLNTKARDVVVTNKHVLKDAAEIVMQFVRGGHDGMAVIGKAMKARLSPFVSSDWFGHPEATVDVAVVPLFALHSLTEQGEDFSIKLPERQQPKVQRHRRSSIDGVRRESPCEDSRHDLY